MIEEYLKKQQEMLFDEKAEYEKENIHIQNHIKEVEKFIDLLEEKNDPNFESFTPRDINMKNRMQIKNLQEEKKSLILSKNDILVKINDCKRKMDELQSIIHCLKKEQKQKIDDELEKEKSAAMKLSILKYVSCEKEDDSEVFFPLILEEVTDISEKLKQVLQWLDMDRVRSKVEIQQILKKIDSLNGIMQEHSAKNRQVLEQTNFISLLDKYARESNEKNKYLIELKFHDSFAYYETMVEQSLYKITKYIIEAIAKSLPDLKEILIKQQEGKTFKFVVPSVNQLKSDDIVTMLKNDEVVQIYFYLLSITMTYEYIEPDALLIYLKM